MSSDDESASGDAVVGQANTVRPSDSSPGPAEGKGRKRAAREESQEAVSLYCDVCRVSTTSDQLMQEHLQGRKHMQAVRTQDARAGGRYCEACDLAFTSSAQLTEHMKGRKHRERAAAGASSARPTGAAHAGVPQQRSSGAKARRT